MSSWVLNKHIIEQIWKALYFWIVFVNSLTDENVLSLNSSWGYCWHTKISIWIFSNWIKLCIRDNHYIIAHIRRNNFQQKFPINSQAMFPPKNRISLHSSHLLIFLTITILLSRSLFIISDLLPRDYILIYMDICI